MQRATRAWIIYAVIGLVVAPPASWLGSSLLAELLYTCPSGALLTAGGDELRVSCDVLTGAIAMLGMFFFTLLIVGTIVLLGMADIQASASDRY